MRQFIRNIFSSKEKRQEARLAEQRAAIEGERIEMKIETNDGKEKSKNGRKKR